jgi:hypothetical protein
MIIFEKSGVPEPENPEQAFLVRLLYTYFKMYCETGKTFPEGENIPHYLRRFFGTGPGNQGLQ